MRNRSLNFNFIIVQACDYNGQFVYAFAVIEYKIVRVMMTKLTICLSFDAVICHLLSVPSPSYILDSVDHRCSI